jgi:small subunit ribosomal protein S3
VGKKVSPTVMRLGITEGWKSRWFSRGREYRKNLKEDLELRDYISKKLKEALISRVEISRSAQAITIDIWAGRPGVIIGRGGKGVEELKKEIFKKLGGKTNLNLNVKEIRQTTTDAQIVGQLVAEQLEKRVPFRRVLKQMLEQVSQNKEVGGVKIMISGRLNGAEMSRTEWLAHGKIPLHTLRAAIDFAKANAYTTYGVIGVKVWIYKGEKFDKE